MNASGRPLSTREKCHEHSEHVCRLQLRVLSELWGSDELHNLAHFMFKLCNAIEVIYILYIYTNISNNSINRRWIRYFKNFIRSLLDLLFKKIHQSLLDSLFQKLHRSLLDSLFQKLHQSLQDSLFRNLYQIVAWFVNTKKKRNKIVAGYVITQI